MLRILVYDTNYVPGITRVIVLTKIRYWQKKGCRITVLGTKDAAEFYQKKIKGLNYLSLDYTYHIKNSYQLIWEIIKVNLLALFKIKEIRGKFDIVYSQSSVIDFLLIPRLIKVWDKKIKWFVMVDNLVPSPGQRPLPYLQQLLPYLAFLLGNFFLKRADGIFTVTDSIKNYYQRKNYRNVIKTNDGYGIQIDIFRGLIAKTTPKLDALYCGRLHLAKGIMDLVEVVKLVVSARPDFKIGILGTGEVVIKEKFYAKIQQFGLKDNFVHFGYLEGKKKGDLLRNCGFYVSLSYDESFGHSILEALASNKTVIAYDLPVYREVFKSYLKTGQLKLFQTGDFRTITDFVLQGDWRKKKFGNLLENYKWDKICQKELEGFENAKFP